MANNSGIINYSHYVEGGNDYPIPDLADGVTGVRADRIYYTAPIVIDGCKAFSLHFTVADAGAGQNYQYDCELSNDGTSWITFIGSTSKVGSGVSEVVYDSYNNRNGLSYKYVRVKIYNLAGGSTIAPKVGFNLKVNE